MDKPSRRLPALQKVSMSLMTALVLMTFVGSNLYALLWQSSGWLVGTILPAVVVNLTNEQRAESAGAPLRRSSILDEAAQLKAEHMAKYQYFAHFSPDGVSPWHWFDKADYRFAFAGENLAIHFADSDQVVEAWMNSPAHRQNIVDEKFTEIGVGTAKGYYEGYKTVYVVQLFGTPAAAASSPAPTTAAAIEAIREEERVMAEAELTVPVLLVTEAREQSEIELTTPAEVAGEQALGEVNMPANDIIIDETPLSEVEKMKPAPPLPSKTSTADSPVLPSKNKVIIANDSIRIEVPVISTSSGLAVAHITTQNSNEHAGATVSAVLTKPNELLQIIYLLIGTVVVVLLSLSVVLEARRRHFIQVAYGFMLLCGMGTLWYVHVLLTSGAVVA